MITIKKAAALTGLSVKAIRHYERFGLMPEPERTGAGYRLYSESDIARLQQIRYFREMKFPLTEIAALLDAPAEEARNAMIRQQAEVDRVLEEYKRAQMLLQSVLPEDIRAAAALSSVSDVCRPAIVATDLQNDILEGGALACGRIHLILPKLQKLFAKARRMGVPVIYVCDRHYKDDPELQLWNDHMIAGSYGAQIIDAVKPEPGDCVIYKNRFNGFVNTTLDKTLRQNRINTVVMTGWRSDVCVAQTAIEAFYRGYRVAVADDGVNSTTEAEHRQGMKLLAINYNFDFHPCDTILENLLHPAESSY